LRPEGEKETPCDKVSQAEKGIYKPKVSDKRKTYEKEV
jgi:hypothetical protein